MYLFTKLCLIQYFGNGCIFFNEAKRWSYFAYLKKKTFGCRDFITILSFF